MATPPNARSEQRGLLLLKPWACGKSKLPLWTVPSQEIETLSAGLQRPRLTAAGTWQRGETTRKRRAKKKKKEPPPPSSRQVQTSPLNNPCRSTGCGPAPHARVHAAPTSKAHMPGMPSSAVLAMSCRAVPNTRGPTQLGSDRLLSARPELAGQPESQALGGSSPGSKVDAVVDSGGLWRRLGTGVFPFTGLAAVRARYFPRQASAVQHRPASPPPSCLAYIRNCVSLVASWRLVFCVRALCLCGAAIVALYTPRHSRLPIRHYS